MLGADLTKISRFASPTRTFIERILHPLEIEEYEKSEDKTKYLAAHWAIKEALFKADNSLLHFNEIKIEKKEKKYFYPGYVITTSNEDDYYFAVVMKEKNESKEKNNY